MRVRNLIEKALGALGAQRHWTWRGDTPPAITLIGHPFLATGRGQHIRAVWSALRSIGVRAFIYDVYRSRLPDPAFREFEADVIESCPDGLRLFHINGNEVETALNWIEKRDRGFLRRGYNIIYPAWELPRFPEEWARQLERFDEVWAASAFVFDAVSRATPMSVMRIPNACEPHLRQVFDRAHFGLPNDAFLILYLYDLQSYSSRKNPAAVVTTFRRAVAARPAANLHLVLKLNHLEHEPEEMQRLKSLVADIGDRVTILEGSWPLDEARSLIKCCDCLLSLHRSEGFGRGPAEAMFLAKPVIATGWSGNMEFMNSDVSFPVDFRLIPVSADEYLFWEDQEWAEPDIDHATRLLIHVVDNPEVARAVGAKARAHMLDRFSDRTLGARYDERFREIARQRQEGT